MESHHHCHHQQQASHHCHHQQQAGHHGSSCYCTCSSSPYQSQPQLSSTDPLLQALASQLLQQQQIFTHPYIHKPQKHHQRHHDQKQQALFGSLLRRIETLESSLHQLSPSPTITLRDLAARTIQTHFRAYLVRRSQTLRNLKHLAIIKSNFNSLKSSISNKPHFNPQSLSQKAINLLHKLDSIQGGDPMIRDGKRAISRDLVQFLEYIDGVLMKRQQIYSKSMKKVRFGGKNQESTSEDLDDQGGSSDDQREVMENLCKKIEGFSRVYEDVEEEPQIETDESSSSSSKLSNTGEGNSRNSLRSEVNSGNDNHCQGKNENLFSAPLPVQMEPIRDNLMRREKIVKVARAEAHPTVAVLKKALLKPGDIKDPITKRMAVAIKTAINTLCRIPRYTPEGRAHPPNELSPPFDLGEEYEDEPMARYQKKKMNTKETASTS